MDPGAAAAAPKSERSKPAGPASAEILAAFDRLMSVYPKRRGNNPRKPAYVKFERLVRGGVDPEKIIQGAKAYALQQKEACKIDTEFVKQTQFWLSAESWEQIGGTAKPEAVKRTDDDWRRAVKHYVENRFHWPFDLLSPEPGKAGCLIPQHILEEFRTQMPANIRAEVFDFSDSHFRNLMEIWISGHFRWPWHDTPEPGKPGCKIPKRIINEFEDRLPSHMRWMQTA